MRSSDGKHLSRIEGYGGEVHSVAFSPDSEHVHAHSYESRFKDWLDRFNGVATKYLPNCPCWRRALKSRRFNDARALPARGDRLKPTLKPNGSLSASFAAPLPI